MEIKPLVEKAINSLNNSSSIESIMLQTKTVAHLLRDDHFKKWVDCELNGYREDDSLPLPPYRLLGCQVKFDAFQPFVGRVIGQSFPPGILKTEIDEHLFKMSFYGPIAEVEKFSQAKEGNVQAQAPAFVYNEMEQYVNGNIERVYQIASATNLVSIITTVKSKLLDFFLELNDKLEIGLDFSKLEDRKQITQIMNQTINAGIYNSGTAGTIDASHANIAVGNGNTINITPEVKEQLTKLINDIKQLDITDPSEKQDVNEGLAIIEGELQKPQPDGGLICKTLRLFKSIPQVVVNHVTEVGLDAAIAALAACML